MTAPTIFVIDDQESVRHAIGEMLSVFGFTVQTFDSARRFLDQVQPARAGCVVADVRMPEMDGIALVTEMARRQIAIPAILISGHADVPMAVAGIKAGAEDFIEKPVDDAMLVAAINRALSRALCRPRNRQGRRRPRARDSPGLRRVRSKFSIWWPAASPARRSAQRSISRPERSKAIARR